MPYETNGLPTRYRNVLVAAMQDAGVRTVREFAVLISRGHTVLLRTPNCGRKGTKLIEQWLEMQLNLTDRTRWGSYPDIQRAAQLLQRFGFMVVPPDPDAVFWELPHMEVSGLPGLPELRG